MDKIDKKTLLSVLLGVAYISAFALAFVCLGFAANGFATIKELGGKEVVPFELPSLLISVSIITIVYLGIVTVGFFMDNKIVRLILMLFGLAVIASVFALGVVAAVNKDFIELGLGLPLTLCKDGLALGLTPLVTIVYACTSGSHLVSSIKAELAKPAPQPAKEAPAETVEEATEESKEEKVNLEK